MINTLRLCAALLLAAAAASAQAVNYAGTTFEIEMIVFERIGGMENSSEDWPAAPRLRYPDKWVDFDTATGGAPLLVPAATQLSNKAAALNRSGDMRVLFHKAWRQVLQQKRNSPAIIIDSGENPGSQSRLGGSVTLSVARYLHLSTNLWLSEPSDDNTGIPLPLPPKAATEEPLDLMSTADFRPVMADRAMAPDTTYARHVALLQAERRMRSGELHYIDHPAFGVLIEVRTITSAEETSGT
ncbi:peptidoglycan binding protein CsiV [Microbulbifer thermotolerans]|uniref:Peptidoglycan binding protein CsiV n=1 Tax=Microbulbifer thermotolerans TaxID=252514 RepID=A0AB35HVG2_MICTH|nr:CsiV family protein [Microbulbifer thermotolerans]MCX2794456.1 peptidoglycan binding protein CsiV [Microbulbifer thermotolerans]MCX2800433.1 peptidoglycan binding protein CsiV [Microbulbifer thermotolerans]